MLQLSNRFPYNPNLKERACELRKNMTEPEKKLWYGFLRGLQKELPLNPPQLRGKADEGSRGRLRVYRQRPIANFIVDFYIPSCKLVIEVDGETHFTDEGIAYDKERTEVLMSLGIKVLRFTNTDVMKDFEGVCEEILKNFLVEKGQICSL